MIYPPARVVLASTSPQRLALLGQILPDTEIVVIPAGVDEEQFFELGPRARCSRLAYSKASTVVQTLVSEREVAWVIGADTEVIYRGSEMGKPANEQETRAMLEGLRGQSLGVVTGVAVFRVQTANWVEASALTTVNFRNFSDGTLETYLQSQQWQGKSGGYALQGMGVLLTEGISGSYSNVVGLPLEILGELLFEAS